MQAWQIVTIAVLVLLPMALLLGFWPNRERLTSSGKPVERDWEPQVTHAPAEEHH